MVSTDSKAQAASESKELLELRKQNTTLVAQEKKLNSDLAARDAELAQCKAKLEQLQADLTAREAQLAVMKPKYAELQGTYV